MNLSPGTQSRRDTVTSPLVIYLHLRSRGTKYCNNLHLPFTPSIPLP